MPRPASPSPDRPNKRSKVFRACQACVTAKTRCEDVQLDGCYLCRRKGKRCSLRGISTSNSQPPPDHPVASSSRSHGHVSDQTHDQGYVHGNPRTWIGAGTENGDLAERLRIQEERYRELEERLKKLEYQSPFDSQSPYTPSSRVRSALVPDLSIVRTYLKPSAPKFDETLFSPINPDAFPDVISSGMVTKPQMDMAFQLFKHRFSLTFPLSPFLRSSTPTPNHPFICLAVLFHVNIISSTDLAQLIEQSLSALMSGAVSTQAILALFIISLGPVQPLSPIHPQPSAMRLISLAYHIGISLGVSRTVEMALRNSRDLVNPWAEEKMELVLLWLAVINRYNILQIMYTPVVSLIPSPVSLLPDHPLDTVRQTATYLRLEVELISSVSRFVETVVEMEDEWTEERFSASKRECTHMRQNIDYFRNNVPNDNYGTSLAHDARGIEFSLVIRFASFLQNMPSPIATSIRFAGLHVIGTHFIPQTNPGAVYCDEEALKRAEQKLHHLGGTPSLMLTHADQQFGKWPDMQPRSHNGQSQGPQDTQGQAQLDMFDFTQAGWDWMNLLLDPSALGTDLPVAGTTGTIGLGTTTTSGVMSGNHVITPSGST